MTALSPAAALVRRHDPDRFLAALFAPAERREALMLLYAFNHELARAREVASEPTLALIRLLWWREVVSGTRRRHELATPLADALEAGLLARDDLLAMIDGRELEAEHDTPTTDDFRDYLHATAGALAVAAGRALGAEAPVLVRLRALGTAYGVAGQLRNLAVLAGQGRCLLPADLLGAHGLIADQVIRRPDDPALRPVMAELATWGAALLRQGGGRFARRQIAAALPAVLARRDFRRLGRQVPGQQAQGQQVQGQQVPGQQVRPRGTRDRLAVLGAAARAWI